MNFVSSGALYTGDFERVLRSTQRAEAADPDGVSDFWSKAQASYHGSASASSVRSTRAWRRWTPRWRSTSRWGCVRTSRCGTRRVRKDSRKPTASRKPRRSLAKTQLMLRTSREWVAEPVVHLAAAALHRARGEGDACTDALRRRGSRPQAARASPAGCGRRRRPTASRSELHARCASTASARRANVSSAASKPTSRRSTSTTSCAPARRVASRSLGDLVEVAAVRRSVPCAVGCVRQLHVGPYDEPHTIGVVPGSARHALSHGREVHGQLVDRDAARMPARAVPTDQFEALRRRRPAPVAMRISGRAPRCHPPAGRV